MTEQMRGSEGLAANHKLLDELTAIAAELEAGAAASQFRFGASRAYNEIVYLRLQTIGERKVGGLPTWSSFLAHDASPAPPRSIPPPVGRQRSPPSGWAAGNTT